MRYTKQAVAAITVALVGGVVFLMNTAASSGSTGSGSQSAANQSSTSPPRPPWVNPDGTVNMSKLPKRVPVGGPDGMPLRNKDGSIKTIDSSALFAPPPAPGTDPNANLPASGAQVYRFMTTDADGNLVEHVDIIE